MGIRVGRPLAASLLVVALPFQDPPPPDIPPTITITGPAELRDGPSGICSDGILVGVGAYFLSYDDPDGMPEGQPVAVGYETGGDAVAGLDYDVVPQSVDAPGFVNVRVRSLPDRGPGTATLTVTLTPGDGYVVGEPSSVSTQIVHLDGRCDAPTFADVPSNRAQTIDVGTVPVPLQLVAPVNGTPFAALIDGALPPGLGLARDGSFTGAARTAGTYTAVVGSCRPAFTPPPGLCTRQSLVLTVTGVSQPDPEAPCAVERVGASSNHLQQIGFDGTGRFLAFRGSIGESQFESPLLYDLTLRRLHELPNPTGYPVSPGTGVGIDAAGRTVVYDVPAAFAGSGYIVAYLTYDTATGTGRELFRLEGFSGGVLVSPDGRRAYVQFSRTDVFGSRGLFVSEIATGGVTPLTPGVTGLVDVSADGAWLLAYGDTGLLVIDSATGAAAPVELPEGQVLGFSGGGILYAGYDAGDAVRRYDLATGADEVVVAGMAGLRPTARSGNGEVTALRGVADPLGSNGDGSTEAFIVLDGDLRQLTDTSGAGFSSVEAIADDGRHLALLSSAELDAEGRGTGLPRSDQSLHVTRCGSGPVLARTG